MNSSVWVAVEAYRANEKASLLADKRNAELSVAVIAMAASDDVTDDDRAEYYTLTEEIRAEYDAKREKAGLS